MMGHRASILAIMILEVADAMLTTGSAQTFQRYHCADGTQFVLAFYDYDKRAFLQIDGGALALAKRLTVSGARYAGGGVTLKIGKSGITIKHLKRPATSCDLL